MYKRALITVTATLATALGAAAPASAGREVFKNWHIHNGLAGGRPAVFFPAILGVPLAQYQADPAMWAYCPDATDKVLLPNGQQGSKSAAGICMNQTTVIHLLTVAPTQSPPTGWTPIPGSATGYYRLTPRGS